MALTDNTFTEEELTAAVDANPAIIATMRTALGSKKFVLRDEAEETTFKTNFETEVASRKTSEIAQNLEKDVLELTGIPKLNADEKYFDYLKRAYASANKTINDELKELKANPVGKRSEADIRKITELENQLATNKADYTKGLTDKDAVISEMKAGGEINKIVSKIKFNANLPESVVKTLTDNAIAQTLPSVRFQEDGTVIVMDKDGVTSLKDPTTLTPITLDAHIKGLLKDAMDAGHVIEGAGGNKGTGGVETEKGIAAWKGLPSTVTTKIQLTDYLKSIGIAAGTEDFDKLFAEHGEKLKIR